MPPLEGKRRKDLRQKRGNRKATSSTASKWWPFFINVDRFHDVSPQKWVKHHEASSHFKEMFVRFHHFQHFLSNLSLVCAATSILTRPSCRSSSSCVSTGVGRVNISEGRSGVVQNNGLDMVEWSWKVLFSCFY